MQSETPINTPKADRQADSRPPLREAKRRALGFRRNADDARGVREAQEGQRGSGEALRRPPEAARGDGPVQPAPVPRRVSASVRGVCLRARGGGAQWWVVLLIQCGMGKTEMKY